MRDLLIESNYWASEVDAELVNREHIDKAIQEQQARVSRLENINQEAILRGQTIIYTSGEQIGQINALTVANLGKFTYGQPSRISAVTRIGDGKVIDIEQEADLSGNIHTKGILIMNHYFSAHYLPEKNLSFSGSIVFEQSYGEIDGDSASTAEMLTLISSLSEVPIKQNIAITGAIDQNGNIQAIGGVNEKIEGFYSICNKRGLDGSQGVVIPLSNKPNLMLRKDVLEAVEAGKFSIYAISHLDEAIEIMTGQAAGKRNEDGYFPENTVNALVESKLEYYAELHHQQEKDDDKDDDDE
ncbi:MAG: S16 family serine protease [Gammaproteobacteria bacterium]|nr:S16 family serine protease [Gammaproteobacteria bacterium]